MRTLKLTNQAQTSASTVAATVASTQAATRLGAGPTALTIKKATR